MTHQKAKGPAATAIAPDRGSNIPSKETKMNEATINTAEAVIPVLSRRGFLVGAAITAVPAVAVATTTAQSKVSIDDFLANASPSEIAWYHANALADTLSEMHPERSWRSHINHGHGFALIVGDLRKEVQS